MLLVTQPSKSVRSVDRVNNFASVQDKCFATLAKRSSSFESAFFSAALSCPMLVSKSARVFSPPIRILFKSSFRLTCYGTENGRRLEVQQAGSPGTVSCVLN